MSEARFRRPRHRTVAAALAGLNGPFLEQAYGDIVDRAAKAAANKLLERKDTLKRCVSALTIADPGRLASGLAQLAATDWTEKASRRRSGK